MNFFEQFYSQSDVQAPIVYVDVGAMGGISAYWRQIGRYCHVIAFEPDEREFSRLKSGAGITYLPYALHQTSAPMTFYVSRDSGKSSMYQPNMALVQDFPDGGRYETVKEIVFPKDKVRTLDEALAQAEIKSVDFIKLDTQGSELDILKGALRSLQGLFGIEVEVEFTPLYQGQPLFRDVDAFVDAHGFTLVDLRRAFWKRKNFMDYVGRGQLIFGDALYLRRTDIFLNMITPMDMQERLAKIAKAVMVCMVYRLPDYALDLLDKALAKGHVEGAQYQKWVMCVRREASSWGLAHLWGRSIFAKIFNRLSEKLRPASYLGWSDGDRFIGNTRNI